MFEFILGYLIGSGNNRASSDTASMSIFDLNATLLILSGVMASITFVLAFCMPAECELGSYSSSAFVELANNLCTHRTQIMIFLGCYAFIGVPLMTRVNRFVQGLVQQKQS